MDRKYKITSGTTVLNMMFSFKPEDSNDVFVVHAAVDSFNEKVFFIGDPIDGIDYEELEKTIIDYIRPPEIVVPEIPSVVQQKISEIIDNKYDTRGLFNF